MSSLRKKALLLFIVCCTGLFLVRYTAFGQETTETPTPDPTSTPAPDTEKLNDLKGQIADLESKLSATQSKEKSLSSEISVLGNQIKLTELRIDATKEEIVELTDDIDSATGRINKLEGSLDDITKVLINRVVATYQIGSIEPIEVLVSSDDMTDFFHRANYLRVAQENDKKLMYSTVQAKNDYEHQKNIFEDKKTKIESLKAQLEEYTQQIEKDKDAKKRLLDETQGDEENYQKILAQTKAQLAGFQGFVTSQGGASILSNQTSCDDWGCYYNQRDSQWGNTALNGTGYTLASDGCLVTSMAMMYTHYGHRDVTPQTINSVSSNFGGIPPALLRFSIIANGVSSQRVNSDLDSTLASGNPVVIGISYDGGGLADHFLVLLSGSNGDYKMNDPFTPNGHNISFRDRYPSVRIVQYYTVTF